MSGNWKRPTLSSSLYYDDPLAALDWLERAFGFERSMVILGPDGKLAHSEMSFGGGCIMVGSKWADFTGSPNSVGGVNTQMVHVRLEDGIDAHCERARAAGAVIQQGLEDQFYGDRTYRCVDPGGHVWTFGQTFKVMAPEEWDAASGLTTTMVEGVER
jgi:uncharacterized glyoxalase superfamily protein PhnB